MAVPSHRGITHLDLGVVDANYDENRRTGREPLSATGNVIRLSG